MTTYKPWIPPAGAVVDPPVNRLATVDVFLSDGSTIDGQPAENLNWSSVGDGPSIVAYRVIEEYKPAPKAAREWWLNMYTHEIIAAHSSLDRANAIANCDRLECIHVREVLEGREVVAWAVVFGDFTDNIWLNSARSEASARERAERIGGTVVRLTGVMP